ncbi:MAG TPA: hypothetical protein EYN06_07655, partial [Myxococcales bacterium]|nr:hypothetical protein [Myxococcales bacterium]
MNRLNSLVGLLACAGLLFVSTTCASAARRPDMGGVLTIGVQRLPGSINPGTAHDSSSLLAVSAVHAGLYRLQSNGQPELQLLVEQPKRSDNGRRWHCKLRRGLQFHNGKRLRSHDVRDSIERLSETPHRWLTGFLQVIIVDARNFVIQLSRPVSRSELARLLATPALSVLSKNDSPVVGAGPFRVIRRRTRILRLRAVGDHFAGRPYLDAIEFREVSNREELFKYKKVDLILTPTSKLNDAKWLDGPVRETIGLLFHPRNSGHARGDRARFWSQIPRKELVAVVAGDARVAHAFHPLDPPFRPAGKGSAGRGVEGVLMCLESDLNTAR